MPLLPGLLSVTFRKRSADAVIALAADAGLSAIEWGGDVHVPHGDLATAAEVKRRCDDRGLAVSAYGSYLRAGEAGGPSVEAVMDTAVALGAPTVRVWAGGRGSTDTPDRRPVTDALVACCDAAAGRGLTVSTEFHGGTLTDTAESTAALIAAVARPNLRTFWQPPEGMDTVDAMTGLTTVAPHVSNAHVFHWWPDGQTRLPLADGGNRWPLYLTALAALAALAGETRYASLEFIRGDDPDQFRRDAATLKRWLAGLG